jgi:hypothetical protein
VNDLNQVLVYVYDVNLLGGYEYQKENAEILYMPSKKLV